MPALVRAITRIQDADDAPALAAGQNGYTLTWDNATAKFVATALSSATPGGSNTYVQFNDSSAFGGDAGLVYNKTTDVLTIAGRAVVPIWSPASDSTTALKITKADGSTAVVTVDTTNGIVIGGIFKSGVYRTAGTAQAGMTQGDSIFEYQSANGVTDYWDVRSDGAARFYNGVFVTGATGLQVSGISGSGSFNVGRSSGMVIAFDTSTIYFKSPSVNVGQIDNTGRLALGGTHTPTAVLDAAAGTTTRASLRIRTGVAPTTPNDGDIWFDNTSLFIRINGVTKTVTVT